MFCNIFFFSIFKNLFFWNIKKKTFFLYFWSQKNVWLGDDKYNSWSLSNNWLPCSSWRPCLHSHGWLQKVTIHITDDGSNWRSSMHGLETTKMTCHGRISWQDEADGSTMSLASFAHIRYIRKYLVPHT